ncbi:MAG: nitroreductase family protein [Candidatus Aminicenantia bacterium]
MKKISICLGIFLMSMIFNSFLIATTENQPGVSLKETFKIYVRSVQNSDLKNLFNTVTNNKNFFFLPHTGKLINTREGYYKFHEEWFREKDWEMPVELIEVREGKKYGYTNAIFHYRSKTSERRTYFLDSYFTLIFHKEDGLWKVVADICTPISRYFTETNSEIKYTSEQVYLFNIIKDRRTVRKFQTTPVPKEHIMKILDAAHYAPTAHNEQAWKFLVIQDREKLNQLKKEAASWYLEAYKRKKKPTQKELNSIKDLIKRLLENVLSAPVYVAVLVDSHSKYPEEHIYCGTLAAENLFIAARALGYGTGFYTTFFPGDEMKKFFNIPDQYKLICFTPIGVPEKWPEMPPKKKLEEVVVFESF